MHLKKSSIFQKILTPLLAVMVFQAILFYGIIMLGGTAPLLKENSLRILSQNTQNRKNALENQMLQRWSNLDDAMRQIQTHTDSILQDNGTSINSLHFNKKLSDELLRAVSDDLISIIRKNSVTGSFIILSSGVEKKQKDTRDFSAVYFRDPDVYTNPEDYSDITMELGSANISSSLHIRMGNLWQPYFTAQNDGSSKSNIYFKPLLAAMENPEMYYKNLGFWSAPFFLSEKSNDDTQEIITYTVPLTHGNSVYGVLGVEISLETLYDMLPSREIDEFSRGGYILATRNIDADTNQFEVVADILSGNSVKHIAKPADVLEFIENTQFDSLYNIKDHSLFGNPVYGYVEDLNLYASHTPLVHRQWMLIGIASHEALFGIADSLNTNVLIATVLSLLLGIFILYVVSAINTKPLRKLADQIRDSRQGSIIPVQKSGILEVDELSQTINSLTKNQRRVELALERERERYLLALESTTAVIFEYSLTNDRFVLYKFIRQDEQSQIETRAYDNFRKLIAADAVCPAEEREILFAFLSGKSNEITIRCRRAPGSGEYFWFLANGKAVYDTDGLLERIVGSTHNITQQKERELHVEAESRLDKVTRLLNRDVGEEMIRKYLSTHSDTTVCICILDLDDFKNLNNKFGMMHCDILLEEIATILKRHTRPEDILMRLGGDEFLCFLPEAEKDFVINTIDIIKKDILELYVEENGEMNITESIGVVFGSASIGYDELYSRASRTMIYLKTHNKAAAADYDDLLQNDPDGMSKISLSQRQPTGVAGLAFSTDDNIVSLTFNVFEKSMDVKSTIPIFLGKLGRYFNLRRILVLDSDIDFCTSRIVYQWCAYLVPARQKKLFHFSPGDFNSLFSCYGSDGAFVLNRFEPLGLTPDARRMLTQSEDENGSFFCCALYDNGVYNGSAVFEYSDVSYIWSENNKDNLKEIVKIISAHISKSKADLANRAKSEFLSRMSHEIRTPMNAIMGMTSIALNTEALTPKARDCLNKIDSSTRYLLSLINDILDMSRIESGKMTLEKENFDLSEILKGLDILIRPQAEGKGIKFIVITPFESLCLVGDCLRLNQVLINLLSNALKFTPDNGSINVSITQIARKSDQISIRFSVKDTGIGISHENSQRIFNSFEQAEDNTARKFGGTGLGLTISSNLVKMMGGKLELRSEVGSGAEFFFTVAFPLSNSAQNIQEKICDNTPPDFTGRRVLVVEDNDLNVEIAKTMLENVGFLVEIAHDGKEAVDMFSASSQNFYDVVLMDIRMPIMDGLEATRYIRRMERNDARTTPIIAMTANAFDEDMKKSIDSGMNGHLAKPFDMHKFYALLSKTIS